MKVSVDVTYTDSVALALLPVASTRNWAFPAAYSASWIETVSVARCVGVALGGTEVAVRVAVGPAGTGVAVAGAEVGAEVGVRVAVEVGGATVGVGDGLVAVGVRVAVDSGGASRLISKARAGDQ